MIPFQFRFENENFYNPEWKKEFKDASDLINYFRSFFHHFSNYKKSSTREDSYFKTLKLHYKHLLTLGTSGFMEWLDDYKNEEKPS